jgi:hypothetical protein
LGAKPLLGVVVDLDLAYIAGFFDGEGCIILNRQRKLPHHTPGYHLQVSLAQKNRRILDQVVEFFGSGVVYGPRKTGVHYACWSGGPAEKVLRELLPYLICKKEEAEIALVAQGAESKYRGWAYHALRFIKNPDYVPAPPTTPMKKTKMFLRPTRHPRIQELVGCGPNHP